jgi:hypothetical protein
MVMHDHEIALIRDQVVLQQRVAQTSNDLHQYLMNCVAPPRYRLKESIHCLSSRSERHYATLRRPPGKAKTLPLASSPGL